MQRGAWWVFLKTNWRNLLLASGRPAFIYLSHAEQLNALRSFLKQDTRQYELCGAYTQLHIAFKMQYLETSDRVTSVNVCNVPSNDNVIWFLDPLANGLNIENPSRKRSIAWPLHYLKVNTMQKTINFSCWQFHFKLLRHSRVRSTPSLIVHRRIFGPWTANALLYCCCCWDMAPRALREGFS